MDEMMNYIFGDLRSTKGALKAIGRTLKRQRATNQRLGLLVAALSVYAVVAEFHHQDQNAKIKALQAEIEELREKGV